jgi:putative sterol carrier protein
MKLNQVFSAVLSSKKTASSMPASISAPAVSTQQTSPSNSDLSNSTSKHKSGMFFDEISSKLKTDGAEFVKKVNAVIGFQVGCANNQAMSYLIDLKNGSGSVTVNSSNTKPDCTVIINDDDLLDVMNGKLNMMKAFTQKKLKLSGNMGIAMKLNQVFATVVKPQSKL